MATLAPTTTPPRRTPSAGMGTAPTTPRSTSRFALAAKPLTPSASSIQAQSPRPASPVPPLPPRTSPFTSPVRPSTTGHAHRRSGSPGPRLPPRSASGLIRRPPSPQLPPRSASGRIQRPATATTTTSTFVQPNTPTQKGATVWAMEQSETGSPRLVEQSSAFSEVASPKSSGTPRAVPRPAPSVAEVESQSTTPRGGGIAKMASLRGVADRTPGQVKTLGRMDDPAGEPTESTSSSSSSSEEETRGSTPRAATRSDGRGEEAVAHDDTDIQVESGRAGEEAHDARVLTVDQEAQTSPLVQAKKSGKGPSGKKHSSKSTKQKAKPNVEGSLEKVQTAEALAVAKAAASTKRRQDICDWLEKLGNQVLELTNSKPPGSTSTTKSRSAHDNRNGSGGGATDPDSTSSAFDSLTSDEAAEQVQQSSTATSADDNNASEQGRTTMRLVSGVGVEQPGNRSSGAYAQNQLHRPLGPVGYDLVGQFKILLKDMRSEVNAALTLMQTHKDADTMHELLHVIQVEAAAVQTGLADRMAGGAHVLHLTEELEAAAGTIAATQAKLLEAETELELVKAAQKAEKQKYEALMEEQTRAMAKVSTRMKEIALAYETARSTHKTEVELLKQKHTKAADKFQEQLAAVKVEHGQALAAEIDAHRTTEARLTQKNDELMAQHKDHLERHAEQHTKHAQHATLNAVTAIAKMHRSTSKKRKVSHSPIAGASVNASASAARMEDGDGDAGDGIGGAEDERAEETEDDESEGMAPRRLDMNYVEANSDKDGELAQVAESKGANEEKARDVEDKNENEDEDEEVEREEKMVKIPKASPIQNSTAEVEDTSERGTTLLQRIKAVIWTPLRWVWALAMRTLCLGLVVTFVFEVYKIVRIASLVLLQEREAAMREEARW